MVYSNSFGDTSNITLKDKLSYNDENLKYKDIYMALEDVRDASFISN
jgi:hypothetical protein